MTKYIYHGDRFTSSELKGKTCTAVRRKDGKCKRSRLGTMLVEFEEGKHIVLARRLRKVKQTCNYTKETAKLCSKYHNCKYCEMKPQEVIEVHCHLDNPTPELNNALSKTILAMIDDSYGIK